jgi:2-(1,2-epoxy-1,2-dihydrophenyl)acetyl-CoA isomerase
MPYETIVCEKRERVALIRMNQPDMMNALEARMAAELVEAFRDAAGDPATGAIVLTGTGNAFSAGGDISRLMQGFELLEGQQYLKRAYPQLMELANAELPVIAAVNGYAVGAGFSVALLCDIIFASEEAKFGQVFVNIGAVPDCGSMFFLPRLVGLQKAKELVFTGSNIDAREAYRIGIVNRVFPPDELLDESIKFAQKLAAGPPAALRQAKRLLNMSTEVSLETMLELEAYAQSLCFQTEDHKEGITAFLERRKPVFKGK